MELERGLLRFKLFLSTPSARRAPRLAVLHPARSGISIHALREEGDGEFYTPQSVDLKFLSTPSARRATQTSAARLPARTHFYPRPPRGGRPGCRSGGIQPRSISIHALREEGDIGSETPTLDYTGFLSTPSARRATPSFAILGASLFDFYPRPPRGGRRI